MTSPVNFLSPDPFKPQTTDGVDQHLRQLATSVRGLMDGKMNAAQDFDLAVSPAVLTVVTDQRIRRTSRIVLVPVNIHAQTDLHAGVIDVFTADITDGSFTVRHLPFASQRSFRATMLS